MKKISFKKLTTLIFVVTPIFFIGLDVESANLFFEPHKETVGLSEEFYIDLKLELDRDEVPVNGIKGIINFPDDKISFIRAENGKSIIDLWVKKPELVKSQIEFAGVSSHGFDGTIDPFNLDKKLPGLVTRLVFVAKKSGEIDFLTSNTFLNLKDGEGTEIVLSPNKIRLVVLNQENEFKYEIKDNTEPKLEAEIIRNHNLFNNKYVLVFDANDKESGVKEVSIREGRGSWRVVLSPYLLKDQTRHSIINLKATNFAGLSTIIEIEPLPYNRNNLTRSVVVIIFLILLFFVVKKNYAKKK